MDQLLLERAKNGDVDAFAELLDLCRPMIRKVCRHYMGTWEDAEDAAIEAETKLWLGLDKYKRKENFEGFVYRLAANVCLNLLNHAKTEKEGGKAVTVSLDAMRAGEESEQTVDLPDPTENVEAKVIWKEEKEHLKECLSVLPEDQHQALHLTQIQGLPYAQAARILGISEGTVKSKVNRAREKLKRMWSAWDRESDQHRTHRRERG